MTDNPHFAFPFQIRGGRAKVREQDDPDQIMDAAIGVVGTVIGTRTDLPGFGVPEQIFHVNTDEIRAALDQWEPRASYVITATPDAIERMKTIIRINLRGNTDA
jgi:hypothetical protein